jgi:hypothetical protein
MFSPRQFARIGGAHLFPFPIFNCQLPILVDELESSSEIPNGEIGNWNLAIGNTYIANPPST